MNNSQGLKKNGIQSNASCTSCKNPSSPKQPQSQNVQSKKRTCLSCLRLLLLPVTLISFTSLIMGVVIVTELVIFPISSLPHRIDNALTSPTCRRVSSTTTHDGSPTSSRQPQAPSAAETVMQLILTYLFSSSQREEICQGYHELRPFVRFRSFDALPSDNDISKISFYASLLLPSSFKAGSLPLWGLLAHGVEIYSHPIIDHGFPFIRHRTLNISRMDLLQDQKQKTPLVGIPTIPPTADNNTFPAAAVTIDKLQIKWSSFREPILHFEASGIQIHFMYNATSTDGNQNSKWWRLRSFFQLPMVFMEETSVAPLLKRLPPPPSVESYPKIGELQIENVTMNFYMSDDDVDRKKKNVKTWLSSLLHATTTDVAPSDGIINVGRKQLMEVKMPNDVLSLLRQATAEALPEGTDQIHLVSLLDRTIMLTLENIIGVERSNALHNNFRNIHAFHSSLLDTLSETMKDWTLMWDNHSKHGENLFSTVLEDVRKELQGVKVMMGGVLKLGWDHFWQDTNSMIMRTSAQFSEGWDHFLKDADNMMMLTNSQFSEGWDIFWQDANARIERGSTQLSAGWDQFVKDADNMIALTSSQFSEGWDLFWQDAENRLKRGSTHFSESWDHFWKDADNMIALTSSQFSEGWDVFWQDAENRIKRGSTHFSESCDHFWRDTRNSTKKPDQKDMH